MTILDDEFFQDLVLELPDVIQIDEYDKLLYRDGSKGKAKVVSIKTEGGEKKVKKTKTKTKTPSQLQASLKRNEKKLQKLQPYINSLRVTIENASTAAIAELAKNQLNDYLEQEKLVLAKIADRRSQLGLEIREG